MEYRYFMVFLSNIHRTSHFCFHMFRQRRVQSGISKIRDTGLWIIAYWWNAFKGYPWSSQLHSHRSGPSLQTRRVEARLHLLFLGPSARCLCNGRMELGGHNILFCDIYQLSACISTISSLYYLGTNLCIRKKLRTMKLLKLLKNWKSQNRSGTIRKKTSKKPPPMLSAFITKSLRRSNEAHWDAKPSGWWPPGFLCFFFRFYLGYPKAKPLNLPRASILGGTPSQHKNMRFLSNQEIFQCSTPPKKNSHSDQQFPSSKCNGKWEMSTINLAKGFIRLPHRVSLILANCELYTSIALK